MTAAAKVSASCLHDCVAQAAARRPDAVAVNDGSDALTYRELEARANRLAHRLRAFGVGPGSLVAIGLERTPALVVGLLGILKAGGAYLPLDAGYPRERVEFMLADAGAKVLVTSRTARDGLPGFDGPVLLLDDPATFDGEPDTAPAASAGPDDLAYVIYTSGSTGKPKGCLITHRNVVRLFAHTQDWFGFGPDDVWTFFHSHAFDFSVWEIWGALVHGGRVVVVPHAVSRSPDAFRGLLSRERVSVLNQTPSAFGALIHADAKQDPAASPLALRWVVFGGEALDLQMLAPWFARHGDASPRLVNMYGITETTVHVTWRPLSRADLGANLGSVIGVPIADLEVWLLDEALVPVAAGAVGEMFVAGGGVARGYLKRPELTARRFIDWTAPDGRALRLYRTGDLARRQPDGGLQYLGRNDDQVKIRGFRIETGEIGSALRTHPAVRACAVVARRDGDADAPRLVAYIVAHAGAPSPADLRAHLAASLPDYMLPAAYVLLPELPLTANGKLDRDALPAAGRERPSLAVAYAPPRGATEQRVCALFAELLGLDRVGRDDNFFELGGHSLLAARAMAALSEGGAGLEITDFFHAPTAAGLARRLEGDGARAVEPARLSPARRSRDGEPIAIIAMAGRFPGADDVEAFWRNLCEGVESITRFAPGQLDPSIPAALRNDPDYVPARGVIAGAGNFDAAFFGITPREAELMDPQQRIFLELCWECLERAGEVPDAQAAPVGVWTGMNNATYYLRHVQHRPDLVAKLGEFQVMLDNEKDFIATRVAHKLNLTGPAISVHTACSTSLVAICQALDALRAGHCRMALAGGIAITCPPASGYRHQPGGMLSRDGHTRAFAADASGTVFSDGAAVVALKRLADAEADGNPIHAVLLGGAVNNDGAAKASFTAPSSAGQAAVIAMALDDAGVAARSVSYVETHGTATPVGDPIEIEGLTTAYRRATADTGFCAIGSVKSNIGHTVIAAGAAGFIKAALALEHRTLPPTLHAATPNPAIDFAASPFRVQAELAAWTSADGAPRRAGVSSFGVGGTNAHVVLEEAPPRMPSDPAEGPQLLLLSARTTEALQRAGTRLAAHLAAAPSLDLGDVAWTLAVGRRHFQERAFVVAGDGQDAAAKLRASPHHASARPRDVVLMFPGQGAQYAGMGRALHASEPVFRDALDACARILVGELGFDLREKLFAGDADALQETALTQPATFAVEYALARLWLAQGVRPVALIGHSIGEFVAAVVAGIMALEDAARLVARRGRLMQALPPGAMLSVRLPAAELASRLPASLALAVENAPRACVVSGDVADIETLRIQLEADGVACRRLHTSHAFHSAMMDPAVAPFRAEVAQVALAPPAIPIASTLTGNWLTVAEATSVDYWSRHLRDPVRFAPALATLARTHPDAALVEAGPRATLARLARQIPEARGCAAIATLDDPEAGERLAWLDALGRAWCSGVELDATARDRRARRQRLTLPTYPFEARRYWIEAPPATAPVATGTTGLPDPPAAADATVDAPADAGSVGQPLRARIVALIEDVSGIAIGADGHDQRFVALGLDSLSLTQLALQLHKTFGCDVGFRQLMEDLSTVAALATHLGQTAPSGSPPAAIAPATTTLPSCAPEPGGEMSPAADAAATVVPATEAQREIWLAAMLAPEASLAYNEAVTLRLRGTLDVAALHAALAVVAMRHDALRATFSDDGAHMRVAGHLELPWRERELGAEPGGSASALAAALERAVTTPFDLVHGPLFRAELLRLDPDQHVLLLSAHHIVCDGWSWGVIAQDLGTAYREACAGRVDAGAPASAFADFAREENAYLASAACAAAKRHWMSRFASIPPPLDLPVDHRRPRLRGFASRRCDHALDAALVASLAQAATCRGASLYAILLSAFAVLLQRLSGQDDLVIGVPTAGQMAGGRRDLVGHAVNILPLRVATAADAAFAGALERMRHVLLDAFEHQRYGFGTLLKHLAMPRDPSRLPLIDVVFNLVRARSPEQLDFGGLAVEFAWVPLAYNNFELFVTAVRQPDGRLVLECQYNRGLFDAATVSRWLAAYETLLRGVVEDADTPCARLPLLSAPGLADVAALQPAPVARAAHARIEQLVFRQAAATPGRIAVRCGTATWTYARLAARARAIAAALRARGVGPGTLVGIALERTPDMLAAMLGVLTAGAGYVPLDPAFPRERLAFMAADAQLAMLVTETAVAGAVPMPAEQTLVLDATTLVAATEPLPALGDADAIAYVIYTSGSTGRPKGVCVPHRAVANFLASMRRQPGLDADDRLLAITTLSFDIAVLELLLPLTAGASVVLASRAEASSGSGLAALIAQHAVTVMQGTPSSWRLLLDAGWAGREGFKALCGGESLPGPLAQALIARGAEVWNLYGPTETTVWSTCARIVDGDDVSIGRPIDNTTVWILDDAGCVLPIGVPGEIVIGGDGVALGYLRRAELTAERFSADPQANDPRARRYRTGDRGRWRNDGTLEHLGRMDLQVKLRGHRIEPGEIEARLASHAAVARAAVLVREDRPGDQRLVAYLAARPGMQVDVDALRAWLADALPEYMVPQHFVVLDALPALPNGKLDRKALPAPSGQAVAVRTHVAPRDAREARIVAIMQDVLGVSGLGADDDFFLRGGHSLLAAQLVARLDREFEVSLPLRTLFDTPTAAGLAAAIAGRAPVPPPRIQRLADRQRAPLSMQQMRLWMFEKLQAPGTTAYHVPSAHRLRGRLDEVAFQRAFDAVVERQPALRTALLKTAGQLVQIVRADLRVPLFPSEDLSAVPAAEREGVLQQRMQAFADRPFAFAKAPLWRARVYRLADDEHVLFFMPHHFICDGGSLDVFHDDLAACYRAFHAGGQATLPALAYSYGDYAAWHARWLADGRAEAQRAERVAWWSGYLARCGPPRPLPSDFPRDPRVAAGPAESVAIRVSDALSMALGEAARALGSTAYTLLAGAWSVLVAGFGRTRNVVLGAPVHVRPRAELEGLVGHFTSVLPLGLELDEGAGFDALAAQVRQRMLEALAAPDVQAQDLANDPMLRAVLAERPLFGSQFSLQDARAQRRDWGGLVQSQALILRCGCTDLELGAWFHDYGQGMLGEMVYRIDLFSAQTGQALAERYAELLAAIARDPRQKLASLLDACEQSVPRISQAPRRQDAPPAAMAAGGAP